MKRAAHVHILAAMMGVTWASGLASADEDIVDIGLVRFELLGSREDGASAVIPRGERVRGVVSLPHAAKHDIGSLTLELLDAAGNSLGTVMVQRWEGWARAVTKEEAEQERREKKRKERASQLIVSLGALKGAFWATDGIDDSNNTDAAALTGVNLRVTKGISELLAVEAELIGAWTGEAEFMETQGELIRSASLVSAQFGLILRFGDQYVPYIRAGAGIQGIEYDTQLMTSDNPSSSIDADIFWSGGAGLDVRWGDHLVVGLAGSFDNMVNSGSRSVRVVLSVGVGWNPGSTEK